MFREMRRRKQALSQEDCDQLLAEVKRGVLAVNGDDGYPYGLPMNFYYDEAKWAIYLHSALRGHKVDAIESSDKVCFTVFKQGEQKEGDWSYFLDSVICFGRASFVEDEDERRESIKKLGMKYYPTEAEVEVEMQRDLSRMLLIRIDIEHMTGKHVHER